MARARATGRGQRIEKVAVTASWLLPVGRAAAAAVDCCRASSLDQQLLLLPPTMRPAREGWSCDIEA